MESLMDSSEEIFKLDKDMITFKIKFGDLCYNDNPISISEDKVSVQNLTSEYLCFRTQTNKKKIYSVDPSHCIIGPKEIKKLIITLYSIKGEELDPIKHRFKFDGFIIKEDEKNYDPKELFLAYLSKEINIKKNSQKLSVKYIYEQNKEKNEIKNEIYSNIENIKAEDIKIRETENFNNIEKNINEKDNTANNINEKNNNIDINTNNGLLTNNQYFTLVIIVFSIIIIVIYFLNKT